MLRELARAVAAEILLGLLQVLVGARARGEGLGDLVLRELVAGLAHVFARLIQLLAGLVGLLAGLHLVKALAGLVEVVQHAALLVLEALEFALEFVALLLILGGGEGGLQFLEALVQVLLAAGEVVEAAFGVHLIAQLVGGGVLRGVFRLVTVLLLTELKLIQLVLNLVALLALLARLARLRDAEIAALHLEQRLISALRAAPGVV